MFAPRGGVSLIHHLENLLQVREATLPPPSLCRLACQRPRPLRGGSTLSLRMRTNPGPKTTQSNFFISIFLVQIHGFLILFIYLKAPNGVSRSQGWSRPSWFHLLMESIHLDFVLAQNHLKRGICGCGASGCVVWGPRRKEEERAPWGRGRRRKSYGQGQGWQSMTRARLIKGHGQGERARARAEVSTVWRGRGWGRAKAWLRGPGQGWR